LEVNKHYYVISSLQNIQEKHEAQLSLSHTQTLLVRIQTTVLLTVTHSNHRECQVHRESFLESVECAEVTC